MRGKPYTQEEISERIQFAKEHTFKEFAEQFEVRISYARSFYANYEIACNDFISNRVKKDDFIEYSLNHNLEETAKHYGISLGSVQRLEKKYQTKCKRFRDFKMDKSYRSVEHRIKRTGLAVDMIKTLTKTYTDSAIARVFGYSVTRVREFRLEVENESSGNNL